MRYAIPLLLAWFTLAGAAFAQRSPSMPMAPVYSGPPLTGVSPYSLRDPAGFNYGNLYITGQVTNGASFRGVVPYVAPNQLQLALPTERMDNFRRDSFGLERYQGGVNYYAPQPFYRPSTTVYSSGDAFAGRLSAPRGMVPLTQSQYVPGATDLTPYRIRARQEQISPLPPGSPGLVLPMSQAPGMAATPPEAPGAVDMTEGMESRPQFSTLFGLVDSAENERLGKLLAPEAESKTEGAAAGDSPDKDRGVEAAGRTGQAPQAADAGREDSGNFTRFSGPDVVETRKTKEVRTEEDVFSDVIKKLAQPRPDRFTRPEPGTTRAQPGVQADRTDLESLDVAPARRRPTGQPDTILILPADRYVVLDHLGGTEDDLFNDQMRLGDKELRAGQYYQAAARYESAAVLRRTNPLPPAGAALAYLGAGESYRASGMLRRAMKTFPAMIRVRLDVDEFLGKDVVDQRLSELETRLAGSPLEDHVPLVFLVTFMHASRGNLAQRAQWAAKLAAVTQDDRLLQTYARQFLPDEGEQPASAPAASAPCPPVK